MTLRLGVALTTEVTLGHADTADSSPTAGNGFRTRWPDDLDALRELGITDVRITLDWARLQPRPGALDTEWAEWFEQILRATAALDLRPWACLQESSIPRWFDNEGGFDDDETFIRWWPRWVERAADRFGDLVGGWVPFACIPAAAPDEPWADTWGILAGGPSVVATVDLSERPDAVHRYAGRMDLLGAVLTSDWAEDDPLDAKTIAKVADRWGGEIREAADAVDNALVVPGFTAAHRDADIAGDIVSAFRSMLDDAIADGVPIEAAFVEPGIGGPDSPAGLLDADRAPTPSSAALLA